MQTNQISAILLMLGFLSILAASMVGPPRLYQEPSIEAQLELIETHQSAWIVSNALFALAALMTASGIVIFALNQKGTVSFLAGAAGSALFTAGILAYVVFLYRRTVRPADLFTSYAFSPLTIFLLAALVIGLLLIGVSFVQSGLSGWLGYLTILGMTLIGGAALLYPESFFKVFPPQALFLFTFIAGIVIWRN